MPRPSNTEERRAEIVRGLAAVMAERGYEGASIQRIARAAGLSPGLIHYHFGGKQEILMALFDRVIGSARRRIDARMAKAESPRGQLLAFLDALLATGDGADLGATALWSLIGAEAVRQYEVRRAYEAFAQELKRTLVQLIKATCRDEGRSTRGASAMAAGLLATVEGFFAVSAAAPSIVPAGSAAPVTRRMAIGLIESQPESKR
jgi:TetR/AcrR family transcriptional repressor of bet genes